jgi:hypothetical protein
MQGNDEASTIVVVSVVHPFAIVRSVFFSTLASLGSTDVSRFRGVSSLSLKDCPAEIKDELAAGFS